MRLSSPATPTEAIDTVASVAGVLPATIVGSVPALEYYNKPLSSFADVDIFCYSMEALMTGASRFLANGFELEDRHKRLYDRWLRYGLNKWHTNSLYLYHPGIDLHVNLVFKKQGGKPLSLMSQVIESFDYGVLHSGHCLLTGTRRSMREFLFPGSTAGEALPMISPRREDWRQGFISEYQGLRNLDRYVRYCDYGFDMSRVRDDLIVAYQQAAVLTEQRGVDTLAEIWDVSSQLIAANDYQRLKEAAQAVPTSDGLDQVLEALT